MSNDPISHLDDARLLERLGKGDRLAAEELVTRYYQPVYRYFVRSGNSLELAEELTQQTYVRAWSSLYQLRRAASLRSWLYRIASSVAAQHWRRQHNSRLTSTDGDPDGCVAEKSTDSLELAEDLQCLQAALRRLPEKYRQAVILRYFEQMPLAEAAAAAGIRLGTFKSRLSRALQHLRQEMKRSSGVKP